MDLHQEEILIEKARKDSNAFGEIFDIYYPQIFNYTLKRVADVRAAEDITSEVFFKAYSKLWQFRWRKISLLAWIYKIAHHEIAYYFRKKNHTSFSLDLLMEKKIISPADSYDLQGELREMEETLANKQLFLKIHQEMVKLPLKYQEVLTLRFMEDKKIKEIASILNKKEGTIKSLISRGVLLLKEKCKVDATNQHSEH